MSLSNRIAIPIVFFLGLFGFIAGIAFHALVHRSLKSELEGRLDDRITWLEAGLEVEIEDEDGKEVLELTMNTGAEPKHAAEFWQVTTADKRVLWASSEHISGPDIASRTKTVKIGNPDWALLKGEDLQILESGRNHEHQVGEHQDDEGDAEGGKQEGKKEHKERQTQLNMYSSTQKDRMIELVLTAGTSTARMEKELNRLAGILWTTGPLVLILAGVIFTIHIRHQLKPLARMADHTGLIGPGNPSERIGPAGTSTECMRLRNAINSMLDRLAEGLRRERQFASTAAHELRTPLAQLRTEVEVALRKERDATEYHAALSNALVDIGRLQKLVVGLLQITRMGDYAVVQGEPVSVSALLNKVESQSMPVRLPDIPDNENIMINGDGGLFYAAICNVLENAARYAPGEPPSIRVEPDNEYVLVIVGDNGPGIPEGERERIFEPLARLDQARTIGENDDAFGLGLATARLTVRTFGGDLYCQARIDGAPGAEFVFRFQRHIKD